MNIEEFTSGNINFGKKVNFNIILVNDGNTFVSPNSYLEFHKISLIDSEKKTRISTTPVVKGEITLLPESDIETGV